MKIGVRAHDFGRKDEKELAKVIKDAGFSCVQLALTKAIEGINSFEDITEKRVYNIRNEFEKNSVEISVLGCYIEPSILDTDQRLKNIENFKKSLEYANMLGSKIVGTETTNFSEDESLRAERFEILKDSVLRILDKAEKENVFVGIEPVAEHTLNTPQLTKQLLDYAKSEKLKIIFDPVNLVLPETIEKQDEIFNEFFKLVGNEIVSLHAKDTVIENNEKAWCILGEGVINHDLIFEYLLKNKPEISLLREGVEMDSFNIDIEFLKSKALI